VDRGGYRICARSENSVFERGNRSLPIGLTERNEPHAGGHQIGDVALQISRQRENQRDALFCAADAKHEGHRQWYAAVQEVFRDFTQEGIRPHLAESCVIRGGLLRRFECEFRGSAKSRGEFRNFEQSTLIAENGGRPSLAQKERFISPGTIEKVRS